MLANPFLLDMPVPALRALPADWINDVTAIGTTALDRVADVQNPLIQQVRAALESGERPVVIGADCCTPIAVVAGLSRAGVSPRVLWLDAHGDFNTPTTSPSGFLGGMPLAMLVGRGDRRLLEAAGLAPLSERDVVLFDARDLDPDEAIALSGSEIRRTVRSLAALQQALSDDGPWHVHLDVDVVNLEDAPSVGFPVEGGPRLADLSADRPRHGGQVPAGVRVADDVGLRGRSRRADGPRLSPAARRVAGPRRSVNDSGCADGTARVGCADDDSRCAIERRVPPRTRARRVHLPFWAASVARLPPAAASTPVVVYCGHGPRARMAALLLRWRGLRDLHLLDGHMTAWRRSGRPEEGRS